MALDYREFDTVTLYRADQAMTSLLDMRVLPDPLQDDVYLFFGEAHAELLRRPDFDEIASSAKPRSGRG
jgi:hypothetical protein